MDNYWLSEACRAQSEIDALYTKLARYEDFFEEVVKLTVKHDVIACTNGNRYASVSPKKLGAELAKIKEDWATPNGKATV